MRCWLLWLARLAGVGDVLYGLTLLYQGWQWEHVGLHMRTYDGETPWQIEMQSTNFILFHTPLLIFPSVLAVSGGIILFLSWRK
jgi:hypothetical protein